ncbi:hypothetical protein ACEE18_08220 [Corynebacterium freneyi]
MKDEDKKVDGDRVAEIRRLLQDGGDAAVEKRLGASVTATEEYRVAQRQRAAVRRRAEEQRRRAVAQREEREKQRPAREEHGTSEASRAHAVGREGRAREDVAKVSRIDEARAKEVRRLFDEGLRVRRQMQEALRRNRDRDRDRGFSR